MSKTAHHFQDSAARMGYSRPVNFSDWNIIEQDITLKKFLYENSFQLIILQNGVKMYVNEIFSPGEEWDL